MKWPCVNQTCGFCNDNLPQQLGVSRVTNAQMKKLNFGYIAKRFKGAGSRHTYSYRTLNTKFTKLFFVYQLINDAEAKQNLN